MSQSLYRKWRPQHWGEIIGQEHITRTLQNELYAEKIVHAYLFAGPRGTGKTSTARILAKAVNCLNEDLKTHPCNQCEHCQAISQNRYLDLIEIDAASNTSVEDVRDLREKINFSPNHGKYKVYIVDEVHMLSMAAFNALLKTLEEPPAHAIFILATTEPHKIPATVLSRCQRHEFRRIPVKEMVEQINRISTSEGIKIDQEAEYMIARQATGSLRDVISLLDQLASTGDAISLELAQKILGTVANQSVIELIDAVMDQNASLGLEIIHQSLDTGADPRLYSQQIVDYLRNVLLTKMGSLDQVDTTNEIKEHILKHDKVFSQETLLKMIQLFIQSYQEIRNAWLPSLPIEMAFIEALDLRNSERKSTIHYNDDLTSSEGKLKGLSDATTIHQSNTSSDNQLFKTKDKSDSATILDLDFVNDHWRIFLDEIGKFNKQMQALLNSCRPVGVKGLHVYLGCNGDFAKSKIEAKENLATMENSLSKILGIRVAIRCFVLNTKQSSLPPEIDRDGLVASILRDLGGEIVDIQ